MYRTPGSSGTRRLKSGESTSDVRLLKILGDGSAQLNRLTSSSLLMRSTRHGSVTAAIDLTVVAKVFIIGKIIIETPLKARCKSSFNRSISVTAVEAEPLSTREGVVFNE